MLNVLGNEQCSTNPRPHSGPSCRLFFQEYASQDDFDECCARGRLCDPNHKIISAVIQFMFFVLPFAFHTKSGLHQNSPIVRHQVHNHFELAREKHAHTLNHPGIPYIPRMPPILRSAHDPSSPTTHKSRSKSFSGRTLRAKSLPTLDFISTSPSPRNPSPFTLAPILPSTISICKACKTPIIKSPSPPTTPQNKTLHRPARSRLEAQLQSSLLEAHGRAVNIQAAYASASREFNILGNNDRSTERQDLDLDNLPSEWRHAPYTAEVCKVVGTLYGELGRALATSQKSIGALEALLDAERIRLQAGDSEEQGKLRKSWENAWFAKQKEERIEAAKPKKRKRNRNR